MRCVMIGRMGMKQCPKLIKYLVSKHMENLPTPMPANMEAVGPKTAMRLVQAYSTLMEGETMTQNFVVYFVKWVIFRLSEALFMVPMRNVGVLAVFCVLDF